MAESVTNREYEINDPKALAKLSGIQVAVTEMELEAVRIKDRIPEKTGVVAACRVLAKRIFDECEPINALVRAEEMEPAEAKIRIQVIQAVTKIIKDIGIENQGELNTMRAEADGCVKGADRLAKKYEEMATKYERHERMEAEDAEPPPAPKAKAPKGKRKTSKKTANGKSVRK